MKSAFGEMLRGFYFGMGFAVGTAIMQLIFSLLKHL